MKKACVIFLGGWFGISMSHQHFGQSSHDSSAWRQQLAQIERQANVLVQDAGDLHPVVFGRIRLDQLRRIETILLNRLEALVLQAAQEDQHSADGLRMRRSMLVVEQRHDPRALLAQESLAVQGFLRMIREQRREIEQIISESNAGEWQAMFGHGLHNGITLLLCILSFNGNFDERFLLLSGLFLGSLLLALYQARTSQSPLVVPYGAGALAGAVWTYAVMAVTRHVMSATR